VVGAPEAATALSEAALAHGAFAQAIRPPTVPQGSSRLRIVSLASHTAEDLRGAASAFAAAARELALVGTA
jgi:7-keto-8-aminopelargonate synthetase-like enzyme